MAKVDHRRVMDVLGDALHTDPAQRDAMIARVCNGDVAVEAEVRRLLLLEAQAAALLPDNLDASQVLDRFVQSTGRVLTPTLDEVLPQGAKIGPYEIVEMLGQGGMGVVYRAWDSRLDRSVALKSLSPELLADSSYRLRFEREARVLASLSHPNLAAAYGLEEDQGSRYLVMELVKGTTLADTIERGPLPISEALDIAAQVAAGVSFAHDAGIVHRDLKPRNIIVTPSGTAKVLDFGLARPFSEPAARVDNRAPTPRNADVTHVGGVLGTPRYMSPEQVRGLAVDRRADVFAYGCVLYEMLTGRPPFPGSDPAEIAASILEREPDYTLLPAQTPAVVERLLHRMLAKELSSRLRDLGDVRAELEDELLERTWQATPNTASRSIARWLWPISLAALVVLAVTWLGKRSELPVPTPESEHFLLPFPGNHEQSDLAHVRLAVSHDGKQIILAASNGEHQQLWRRLRGEVEFTPIGDTLGAWIPAISPSGLDIAYYQHGYIMSRRVAGGEATRVAAHASYAGRFAWEGEDSLLFTPFWGEGIACIPVPGKASQMLSHPEFVEGDMAHMSPAPTPDGRYVLFTVWNGKQRTRIDAVDREGGDRHNVVEEGECGRIAVTPLGPYLMYTRHGTLLAAPFDTDRCRRSGPEQVIVDHLLFNCGLFEPVYDVADDGTLVYVPGPAFNEELRLAWIAGDGKTTPLNDTRNAFAEPHFAADGKHLSVLIRGEVYRPYILNLDQGTSEPIVSDSDTESCAISPDGNSVAYSSNRNVHFKIWVQDLTKRSDRELPFAESTRYQSQICWSPDSKHVAFSMASASLSDWDIWVTDVQSGEVRKFCDRPSEERAPQFSPDGRWLAYSSDEAGGREIRLRQFPDGSLDHQITAGGAEWPQWSPDGKKLYYRQDQKLWSVPIDLLDGSTTGPPSLEYDHEFGQSDFELSDYAIAPDGRLLLVEPSERGPRVSAVHVLLNWYALLAK